MIRGKKNFLTPSQPQMALGLLFKLSEDSIAKRLNEKKEEIEDGKENQEIFDEESFIEIIETELSLDEKAEVFHKSGELEFVDLQKKKQQQEKQQQQQENEEKGVDRKLTTKDKKNIKELMKKGFTEKEATEIVKKIEEIEEEEEEKTIKQKPIPRGKKSKLKKIKKKYGDQDEDERKIKMKLLGHKIESDEEEGEDEEQEKEEDNEEEEQENLQDKKEEKIKKIETITKIEQPTKEEIIQKQKESEEISKLMVEENISFLNSEVSIIDSLTSTPKEDDEILYAIPGNYFKISNVF